MPLSAGLTWKVEGEKTEESSLENPGTRADSQGKTRGEGKSNLESRGRRFF